MSVFVKKRLIDMFSFLYNNYHKILFGKMTSNKVFQSSKRQHRPSDGQFTTGSLYTHDQTVSLTVLFLVKIMRLLKRHINKF